MENKEHYTPEEVAEIAEGYRSCDLAYRAKDNPSIPVLNHTISAVQNIPPNVRARLLGLDKFLDKLKSDLPARIEY